MLKNGWQLVSQFSGLNLGSVGADRNRSKIALNMDIEFDYTVHYWTLETYNYSSVPAVSGQNFKDFNPLINRQNAYDHIQKLVREINNFQIDYGKKAIEISLVVWRKGKMNEGIILSSHEMTKKEELQAAMKEVELYRKYEINPKENLISISDGEIINPPFFNTE